METDTTSVLSHQRLCHVSEKGIQTLASEDLISEVKKMHLEKCVRRMAVKKNRTSF